jgi:general secretion pathway protein M
MADIAVFSAEMRRQAEDLASRLMASDAGQRLLAFHDRLGERDRIALRGLGWFGAAVLMYVLMIAPLVAHVDAATRRLQAERELLTWLQSHDSGSVGGAMPASGSEEALATVVNETAEQAGLSIRRYEPAGEDGVRLWMEGADFNALVKWLFLLEGSHGVSAAEFNIERESDPGKVSVRITLRG